MNRKKGLVINWNCCIPDMSEYFDISGNLVDMLIADFIILWNDIEPAYRGICTQAKGLGIPVFCMEHGLDPVYTNYWDKVFFADYFFAWSESQKELLLKVGWPEDRVIVVGCPLFRNDLDHRPDGKVAYFPTRPESQDSLLLWNRIRKIDGIHSVIKLVIPGNDVSLYEGDKVISLRGSQNHSDMVYLSLKNASCMVMDEDSTQVLFASHLDIPIIKPKNEYPVYHPSIITEFNPDKLEDSIYFALGYPEHLRVERQEFVDQFQLGDCAANIYNAIMNVLDKR